jgi:predicted transcriptional regulator
MNIILSIKPKWARLIYEGKKTIEWRKSFPKATKIDKVFLYETAPVKQITGFFTLEEIGCILVHSVCAQPWNIIERGCVHMTDLIKYRENVDCIFGWMID